MRIFLILSGLVAVVFGYLTVNSRGVAPEQMVSHFSERRIVFDAWLAACRPGGVCLLTSLAEAEEGAADAADPAPETGPPAILRIESLANDRPPQVAFLAAGSPLAPDSPLRAHIDAAAPIVFTPLSDGGWRQGPDDPPNAYRFAVARSAKTLLPAMRAGGALTLSYWTEPEVEEGGRDQIPPAETRFSLIGLSAALDWAEANRLP